MSADHRLLADAQSAVQISADPLCRIFFFFLLSAGLLARLEVHPSVLRSFAPVLITFSMWFAFALAAAYQSRLLLTAL